MPRANTRAADPAAAIQRARQLSEGFTDSPQLFPWDLMLLILSGVMQHHIKAGEVLTDQML